MTNENKSPDTVQVNEPAVKGDAPKAGATTGAKEKAKPESGHKEKSSHHHSHSHRGNGFVYFLIILMLAGTGAGGYWFWKQQTLLQQTLAQTQQQNTEQATALQQQISANKQAQEETLQQFQLQQKELDTSLKNLHDRIGNTTRDWAIAEADYLLDIANYRLMLEQDVTTAITALKLADQRVRMISEPSLLKVRNSIAKELTALETLEVPDITGIALNLNGIVEQIEHLPLRVRTMVDSRTDVIVEEKPETNGFRDFLMAVWHALKSLVTVRYNDRPTEPLLAPEEISYLKQNVKLKIEQAQLALLQHNQALFQQDLSIAAKWINTYFETEDQKVANTSKMLLELSKKTVALEIPDISESKQMLKASAKRINLDLPMPAASKKEESKP